MRIRQKSSKKNLSHLRGIIKPNVSRFSIYWGLTVKLVWDMRDRNVDWGHTDCDVGSRRANAYWLEHRSVPAQPPPPTRHSAPHRVFKILPTSHLALWTCEVTSWDSLRSWLVEIGESREGFTGFCLIITINLASWFLAADKHTILD